MSQILSVFAQLKSGRRLPSPKGVVLRLIELSQQEDASVAQVTRLVQSDPALAGRIVRAANSVASAPARPVVACGDAILRLGLPAVFQLALGFSLVSQYREGRCAGFDYDNYWSRSLLQAVGARAIAMRLRLLPAEEAFVCGLLGRVGRLALATAWPEQYGAVHASAEEALEPNERAAFGISHRELTSCLLQHWGFPPPLAAGIVAHEAPSTAVGERTQRIARLLRVAARIADFGCAQPTQRAQAHAVAVEAAEAIGIDAETLGSLREDVLAAWTAWCPIFELDPAGANFEPLEPPAANEALAPAARGLRLLIAGCDPDVSRSLASLLTDSGNTVRIARGEVALPTLVEEGFDGVLMEWDAAGLAACRALRRTLAGRRLHVIALGAARDDNALENAVASGADDYLARPFQPRVLEARLTVFRRVAAVRDDLVRDLDTLKRYSSNLESTNRKLQVEANTDPLTGLARREAGLGALQAAFARAVGEGSALSCLLVDIDDLKLVNERHGRLAGDRAVTHVGRLIAECLPPGASLARFGGDEFLVVLPGRELEAAGRVAEAILRRVHDTPLALRGPAAALRVSVGAGGRAATASEMITQAFEAAATSTRLGGQRFTPWHPSSAAA